MKTDQWILGEQRYDERPTLLKQSKTTTIFEGILMTCLYGSPRSISKTRFKQSQQRF